MPSPFVLLAYCTRVASFTIVISAPTIARSGRVEDAAIDRSIRGLRDKWSKKNRLTHRKENNLAGSK